jgi:hypothetical protein
MNKAELVDGHWFRLMGYIVRNAHSAGITAILEVNCQNPYSEGILSIFPITRNQYRQSHSPIIKLITNRFYDRAQQC